MRSDVYYERSELLIDGDGNKSTKKNVRRTQKKRAPSLPASDSELRPRRGGVRLPYGDPTGE